MENIFEDLSRYDFVIFSIINTRTTTPTLGYFVLGVLHPPCCLVLWFNIWSYTYIYISLQAFEPSYRDWKLIHLFNFMNPSFSHIESIFLFSWWLWWYRFILFFLHPKLLREIRSLLFEACWYVTSSYNKKNTSKPKLYWEKSNQCNLAAQLCSSFSSLVIFTHISPQYQLDFPYGSTGVRSMCWDYQK